MKDPKMN